MKKSLIYWIKWEREKRLIRYDFDDWFQLLDCLKNSPIQFGAIELMWKQEE